eukprot:comp18685_c0_seq1/m.20390 comp18685_c0_seq1/g.20390  ORF comp18685_c0_seq1/g.20390 comp18685_c0_seq1/m.20390 type:complete len:221 (-) comp18685_c0_seq1:241-903(-)
MVSAGSAAGRGALIVLEGCDRSGKSTQCANLVKALCALGTNAKLLRFPDRMTTIGQMINAYLTSTLDLSDQAIHLLFSANRWEAMASMRQQLQEGTTLVVDRYAYSGVAFTAAKGIDAHWCRQPDVGLLKPDLTLFLDLPVEEAAKRGDFGQERYERRDFQEKVYAQFGALRTPEWKVIDARGSIEDIGKQLLDHAQATIRTVAGTTLGTLWTDTQPASH